MPASKRNDLFSVNEDDAADEGECEANETGFRTGVGVVGIRIVGNKPHIHECRGILSHERGKSEEGLRGATYAVS